MTDEILEAEHREVAVVKAEPVEVVQIFPKDPIEAMEEAQRIVKYMAKHCTGKGFISPIKNKKYPKVEWWTTIGSSLGLFAVPKYAHRLDRKDEIAYDARVEVFRNGQLITAGEAICSSKEAKWRNSDEYAIKSMAITRATAKAFRTNLAFMAALAGLEATPAEEVVHGFEEKREQKKQQKKQTKKYPSDWNKDQN